MEEMSGAGMIKIEVLKNVKRRVIVSLTPYGRDVADRLRRSKGPADSMSCMEDLVTPKS